MTWLPLAATCQLPAHPNLDHSLGGKEGMIYWSEKIYETHVAMLSTYSWLSVLRDQSWQCSGPGIKPKFIICLNPWTVSLAPNMGDLNSDQCKPL